MRIKIKVTVNKNLLITVFINVNITANNLTFNIKEIVYEEKVKGKNASHICRLVSINQPKITISTS